jgi:predicted GNAT family acetyltransferase
MKEEMIAMNYIYETNKIYVNDENGKLIVDATFPFVKEGVVVVDHTYVDPSLRGQGVASNLMQEVYNHIKNQGLKAVATCPYAVVWFKRHPECKDIIAEDVQDTLHPECKI